MQENEPDRRSNEMIVKYQDKMCEVQSV